MWRILLKPAVFRHFRHGFFSRRSSLADAHVLAAKNFPNFELYHAAIIRCVRRAQPTAGIISMSYISQSAALRYHFYHSNVTEGCGVPSIHGADILLSVCRWWRNCRFLCSHVLDIFKWHTKNVLEQTRSRGKFSLQTIN